MHKEDITMALPTQIGFLRNKELHNSRSEAVSAMKKAISRKSQDGSIILSRYRDKRGVKTLLGVIYNDGMRKTLSIFKTDEVITHFETSEDNLHYGDLYKERSEKLNPTKVTNP